MVLIHMKIHFHEYAMNMLIKFHRDCGEIYCCKSTRLLVAMKY